MVEGLMMGITTTLKQNVVYALPHRHCKLYTETAGATLVQSNTEAFTASTAVTLVEGSYEVSAGFIKCTSGDILATLRKA